jgi:hypothetical protein
MAMATKGKKYKGKGGFGDHPEHINIHGRPPKGQSLAERFRDYMEATGYEIKLEEEIAGDDLDGMERRDLYVRAVYRAALAGNGAAMRLIIDHIDGLPVQAIRFDGTKKGLVISFPEDKGDALSEDKKDANVEMNLERKEENGGDPATP